MKVGYSKTYPILVNGQWEKIWLEDDVIGSEEDIRKAQYKLKRQVEDFHYESTKAAEKQIGTQIVDDMQSSDKTSQEFEKLKEKLNSFEFKEDAQAYLDTTDFNLTVKAKNIVNSKKSKK